MRRISTVQQCVACHEPNQERHALCADSHMPKTMLTCSWWSGCLARCSSPPEMSKERDTDCWVCDKRSGRPVSILLASLSHVRDERTGLGNTTSFACSTGQRSITSLNHRSKPTAATPSTYGSCSILTICTSHKVAETARCRAAVAGRCIPAQRRAAARAAAAPGGRRPRGRPPAQDISTINCHINMHRRTPG